jgi:CxxC motif-containing protein (DUF1111 family)
MSTTKIIFVLCAAVFSTSINAETDPGVRGGVPGAGPPLAGLTANQVTVFGAGAAAFAGAAGGSTVPTGLGPRFNGITCLDCHQGPASGGSSGLTNPQPALAVANGAQNVVPSFITQTGPVRVVRFINKPDGTPDGSVHQLFTIRGRTDAPPTAVCNIQQEDFAFNFAIQNLAFRIPTPIFGAGLIEGISDNAILANKVASANIALGISGREHRHSNDGTISRFGWKAQNKSLMLFAGEAANVEMGQTNRLFPHERAVEAVDQGCLITTTPDQHLNFAATNSTGILDRLDSITTWMQFLAPPIASSTVPGGAVSITAGKNSFISIGCANCHTQRFTTGPSPIAALSVKPVELWSDLLLHKMGPGLADRIVQGSAMGDEFRTAPLWGLGQRRFFLHDGRTSDLVQAIQAHRSLGNASFPASEANRVIDTYNLLSNTDRQNIVNFLRSL